MATLVPGLKGLKPVEEIASCFYLRPAEVKAILDEQGVPTIVLSVSRKRVELVNSDQATAAIAKHLLADSAPADGSATQRDYVPISKQLSDQAEQVADLTRKIKSLEAALLGGGSND